MILQTAALGNSLCIRSLFKKSFTKIINILKIVKKHISCSPIHKCELLLENKLVLTVVYSVSIVFSPCGTRYMRGKTRISN